MVLLVFSVDMSRQDRKDQVPPASGLWVRLDKFEGMLVERDTFGTHHANVITGQELGLTLLYTLVSSLDEWDRYEGLQWHAAETYALDHPDDPDVPELLERVRREEHQYLRWGRDTVGWALYLFRK